MIIDRFLGFLDLISPTSALFISLVLGGIFLFIGYKKKDDEIITVVLTTFWLAYGVWVFTS